MSSKKRGLLQRLFGSKKMSFESMDTEEEEAAALEAFQASSAAFSRRHTVDVETFRGDMSDEALMAAASGRITERQTSDDFPSRLHRFHSRFLSHAGDMVRPSRVVGQRQRRATGLYQQNKPTTKPSAKPALPPRTTSSKATKTSGTRDTATTDTDEDGQNKNSGSFRRRLSRRDRLLRYGNICKVDTSQPIVYPTTPETILEYHKAMPFLDENEEWLMVELNEYECLVDSLTIIKIIAKHSKFFEVEPDELWEEFFEFVDDVPAYDEVINFDVWQEFRDKKYTC